MSKAMNGLRLMKDVLLGKEMAYTEIPIKRAILLLAIPMVIEMGMESLFAIVDAFFVAKLGAEALATVGYTESMMTIVYSLGFGIAMAATAMVARRVGEKNIDAANVITAQVIWISIGISAIIAFIGLGFGRELLEAIGAEQSVIETGIHYTNWMFGGNVVILLLFLLNGVFRGAGNASIAMWTLLLSNGLNIVLDPLLIMGYGPFPECGLVGAAYATNIGRGVGVLFQLFILLNGRSMIRLLKKNMKIQWPIIRRALGIAAGGTGQFIISSASWIVLVRIMADFGTEVVAGYTAAIRVLIFFILPAWGLSNAAATLVGQNLGALQPDRAEKSVWITVVYNVIFLGTVSIFTFFFATEVISLFSDGDPIVLEYGTECMQYLSFGYVFFAAGMVIAQAFNGAGDTKTPTLLNLIAFWIIQIPLAYLLAKTFNLGPKGVFLAIVISESLLAVGALILFQRGNWKKSEI